MFNKLQFVVKDNLSLYVNEERFRNRTAAQVSVEEFLKVVKTKNAAAMSARGTIANPSSFGTPAEPLIGRRRFRVKTTTMIS